MLPRSIGRYGILVWALVLGMSPAACPEPSPLDEVAHLCSTPEQLAAFLKRHILFQEDVRLFNRLDYWQEPEEFLARGAGDCEDYALFSEEVLRRQGREVFVLSLYGPEGYAHTVCVFQENGRYHVLNQDRVIRYGARNLEELAGDLCRDWAWGAVARRAGTRGQAIRRIIPESRPSPSGFQRLAGR